MAEKVIIKRIKARNTVRAISISYDNRNNLIEALSPDEGRNRWNYDLLGRCTRYENAKNGITEYEYNLLGDAVKIKLPDGNIRELTYDEQGNIIHAKDKDRNVGFTYHGVNKLASRTERGATLRFLYNTEDQLRFVENEDGDRYEFKLNAQGEVVEETGFDGLTRRYNRDLAGRVVSVERPSKKEIFYEYDEAGRVTKVRYEDGTEESYEYRKDGLLTKAVNPHAEVILERDILGRVIKESSGLQTHTGRDNRGRVISHQTEKNSSLLSEKSYLWGTNDKLLSVIADGKETRYEWNAQGMLDKVKRPDAREVIFRYDALGRRTAKQFGNIVTRWTWDGNVPLHEQKSDYYRDYEEEKGEFLREEKRPLVTWVFEEGTFVPTAKLTNEQKLSIATNYMGTPEAMYRDDGEKVWACELSSYGKVRKFQGEFKTDCPFRYQGQYEDSETGLYYNRFRYYSPEEGMYISQDPIGLFGGSKLYSYVQNPNYWVDILGLKPIKAGDTGAFGDLQGDKYDNLTAHHMPQDALRHLPKDEGGAIVITQQEHEQTRTYFDKGKVTKVEDADKPFRDVLIMDIEDLRSITGDKYDASIEDLIKYYEEKGKLEEGELTLDSIKDGSCHKT
ncbi:hypothetical protein FACS1894177_06090 [Bacteroidia bacterium]|nr:hypothetical protein FACS1894177_06090 [Bacteroidia bacterium]